MTQDWRRLGIIHRPGTTKEWAAHGYCHVPTPLVMGDTVRVYYASLDANNRGSIGYCDLDGGDLTMVKYVSPEPVLTPGPLGAFDCDGVVPSCIIHLWDDNYLMWYIGFQRQESTPYSIFSGIASSLNGGESFDKLHNTPSLDRNYEDPYSRGAPFLLNDNGRERIWYWSCTHWSEGHYNNVIRHRDEGGKIDTCISPVYPEYALGRPWVLKENGIYRMWYSIRTMAQPSYHMGYAESNDGLHWTRKDSEVQSLICEDGRNAEYPAIVDSGGKRWCIFNGAHNGRDGIELAVLESE